MERAKILIVDDDLDLTEAMGVVLNSHGYSVDSAADASQAREYLKSCRPDLMILDVMMDTNRAGFILCRELKMNPNYKNIPIIMVSAVKEKTGINFKSAAGDPNWLPVEEFLDKPIEFDVLLEKVKQLLQKTAQA